MINEWTRRYRWWLWDAIEREGATLAKWTKKNGRTTGRGLMSAILPPISNCSSLKAGRLSMKTAPWEWERMNVFEEQQKLRICFMFIVLSLSSFCYIFFSRVVSHLLQRNIHNTHAHDARRHSRVDNFPWRVRSTVALRLTLLLRFTWLKSTKKMNVAAIYHDKLQCARQMLFFVIWFVSFWFSIACQQIPHPSSWCSYSFVFFVVFFV